MNSIDPTPTEAARADAAVFVADPALTIYTVEAFADRCKALLAEYRPVVIDLSRVTTCDTLGLQALWAARRSAELRGQALCFQAASEAVLGTAEKLGCAAMFGSARKGTS